MPTPADIALIHRLADAAGAVIRPYFRRRIDTADKGAEQAIRAILESERPDDGILGEEFPEKPSRNGRIWVVDPMDGTRAFITGQTQWGTLIALNENGTPTLGVLDQPVIAPV